MSAEFSRMVGQFLRSEQAKEERQSIAQRIIVVLGILCGVALILVSLDARSQDIPAHVFEDETVTLNLFVGPCEDKASQETADKSPLKDIKLKKATSTWAMNSPVGVIRADFAGCWTEFTWRGRQGYAVAFSDGEIRFFPADGFKRTKGTSGA